MSIENSYGELMADIGHYLKYSMRKIDREMFLEVMGLKGFYTGFRYDSESITYTKFNEEPKTVTRFQFFYICAEWASLQGYKIHIIDSETKGLKDVKVFKLDDDEFEVEPVFSVVQNANENDAMYVACELIWEHQIFSRD